MNSGCLERATKSFSSICPLSDDFRTCAQPKDSGGCNNKIFRYYYNAIERRCKLFVYGGCDGNSNNFLSEIQCLQKCGDDSILALLAVDEKTTTTEIGV